MFTVLVQEPQTGDVEHVVRMEIGRHVQCADSVESQHRIEFVQLQSRRTRKRKEKHSSDSSNGSSQKTIAKLEEQLKAARNENKRLVARAQQADKAKEPDVAFGSVDDGRGAAANSRGSQHQVFS